MIVLPRVLHELLAAADERHQKQLVLDFAEHAAIATMGSGLPDEYSAYLRSARDFVNGDVPIAVVAASYVRFYGALSRPGAARDVASLVMGAVRATCGRELHDHGAVTLLSKHGHDVRSIARNAQKVVARWSSSCGSPEARSWEEARWQLRHVISTAPNPHASTDGS